MLAYPETLSYVPDYLSIDDLQLPAKDVYKAMLAHYNGSALDADACFKDLDSPTSEMLKIASLWVEKEFGDEINGEVLKKEVQKLAERVKSKMMKLRSQELTFQIKEAESQGKAGEGEELLHQKQSIHLTR